MVYVEFRSRENMLAAVQQSLALDCIRLEVARECLTHQGEKEQM
jgi:hypothetical protein